MGMAAKLILAWSGGKDSALALYALKKDGNYDVSTLLTTVTEDYGRISMHGIRRALLKGQAEALSIPLEEVLISKDAPNEVYDSRMRETLTRYLKEGVSSVAFGDIFLEGVRKYRQDNLLTIGMKGIFPLWKRDTQALARSFIASGFKAVITCVDSEVLPRPFAGRAFDEQFLADLPSGVDPCGENGEFHSFVYDGPIFQRKILYEKGEVIVREGRFYYCDLVPKSF